MMKQMIAKLWRVLKLDLKGRTQRLAFSSTLLPAERFRWFRFILDFYFLTVYRCTVHSLFEVRGFDSFETHRDRELDCECCVS